MAKKNKNMQVESAPVSKFTGGLLSLIWCYIVMFVCFVLASGVGVVALYALTGFNFDAIGKRAILGFALLAVFMAIGMAWAMIKFLKWETKHTIISNNQLKFKATSLQLVGTCLKWGFLTVITFGIYGLWLPIKVRQWRVKHTTAKYIEDDYAYQPQITFTTY